MGAQGIEINDDSDALDIIMGIAEEKPEASGESSEEQTEKQTEEKQEETVENSDEEVENSEEKEVQEEETQETQEETEEEEEEKKTEEEEEKTEEETEEKEEEAKINEKLVEVAKAIDPDAEFESDDQAITSIKEELDDLKSYKTDSEKANEQLANLFEAEEGLKGFIQDLNSGMDAKTAFALNIDESLAPEEHEENYNKYAERRREREEKLRENKKTAELRDKNVKESAKIINSFKESNKLDDSKANEILKELDTYIGDVYQGKLSQNFLDTYYKGLQYDDQIKAAEKRGEVRAKNEKAIDKKRKQKERKTVPAFRKASEKEERKPKSVLDPELEKAVKADKASNDFFN